MPLCLFAPERHLGAEVVLWVSLGGEANEGS